MSKLLVLLFSVFLFLGSASLGTSKELQAQGVLCKDLQNATMFLELYEEHGRPFLEALNQLPMPLCLSGAGLFDFTEKHSTASVQSKTLHLWKNPNGNILICFDQCGPEKDSI